MIWTQKTEQLWFYMYLLNRGGNIYKLHMTQCSVPIAVSEHGRTKRPVELCVTYLYYIDNHFNYLPNFFCHRILSIRLHPLSKVSIEIRLKKRHLRKTKILEKRMFCVLFKSVWSGKEIWSPNLSNIYLKHFQNEECWPTDSICYRNLSEVHNTKLYWI